MIRNRLYYFLTFWVIAISGNPAMAALGKEFVAIGTLILFLILYLFSSLKLTRHDLLVFGIFAFITVTHVITFGTMVVAASIGFLIKLVIALLAVKSIPQFLHRYILVMYVLSIISFIFFIPLFLGVDLRGFFEPIRVPLSGGHYHIGIANLMEEADVSVRNMGMFWEPGAFAGYLILALFFLVRTGPGNALMSKKGLVLTAALLSTQSTTGYLAFMVLILYFAYNSGWAKSMTAKLIVLPLLLLGIASIFFVLIGQVSFLGEKINAQLESTVARDEASRITRFGNFLDDLKWIADKPVLGWSANPETRFSVDPEVAEIIDGQGNGLTGFAVKFGLVGLFVFIGSFAYTTRRITGSLSVALFGILIVCLLLNGEQFLGFSLFLSLMFLPHNKSITLRDTAARKPSFADRRMGYRA